MSKGRAWQLTSRRPVAARDPADFDRGCQTTIIVDSVPSVRSPGELVERFRAEGLKVTPQRVAVFEVLHGSTAHPTAEAVYESVRGNVPGISLRTVYQTLHDLAAMGELLELDLGTGSARFDPLLEHHDHFVCDHCGSVHDLAASRADRRVAESLGHRVARTDIVHRGLCRACAGEAGAS